MISENDDFDDKLNEFIYGFNKNELFSKSAQNENKKVFMLKVVFTDEELEDFLNGDFFIDKNFLEAIYKLESE